ncbi:hypothetical protein HMI55_006492 [Coelomomyces lativittatus]|nr:hypothetical protein HMI55_006492 [Coelomomyces lativittatus]
MDLLHKQLIFSILNYFHEWITPPSSSSRLSNEAKESLEGRRYTFRLLPPT